MNDFNERIKRAQAQFTKLVIRRGRITPALVEEWLDALKEPEEEPAEPEWTPKVGERVRYRHDYIGLEITARIRYVHAPYARLVGTDAMDFLFSELELLEPAPEDSDE